MKNKKMNNILAINFFSKNESPYVDHYTKEFERMGISYDVIYFERYNMDYVPKNNEIIYKRYCPTGGKKYKKIRVMLGYVRFLRRIIKKNDYDGIVVFTTNPAIVIFDILLKRYKNKYILDIRDYTNESNKFFYYLEKKIIRNSFSTVISSRGFLSFLPDDYNYVVTHNVPVDFETVKQKSINSNNNDKLTIGFVGSVRYYEENIALIESIRKSNKYSLVYHGSITNECDIEGYCKKHGIDCAAFFGKFKNSNKNRIYETIDIINSIYGVNGLETKTALPNRLYDACIYRCPLIVSEGTYLAEVVEKYNIGIAVNVFNDDVVKLLDDYFLDYCEEEFNSNCDKLLSDVKEDLDKHKDNIRKFGKEVIA